MTSAADTRIPYYWQSVDWPAFMADYPPPPHFESAMSSLSNDELRAQQETRFLARMTEAWRVPFYRKRWAEAGLEPGDIRSLDDLDRIPTFTSDDLKDTIQENPPFGAHQSFALEPVRSPLKIQTSGGTSGLPRPTLFDPIAWEVQAVQFARAFYAQGGRVGDVLQITLTNSLANTAWCSSTAAMNWCGMIPLTTGSGIVTPSLQQLQLAEEWKTAGWVAFGEYLKILAETAQEHGYDLRSFPTKFLHTYLGIDTDGHLRRLLEDAWNAPVYDNYGTHEVGLVAYECSAHDGLHVQDDTAVLQIQSRDTGRAVDDGGEGNLVVTSIHRSVPPIIRYNLRDLMRVYDRERCGCGTTTTKLSGFLGRSDEMVKLRATSVYPRAAQGTVQGDPRATGEFLCVVENVGDGLSARERMTVRIEARRDVDQRALAQDMGRDLKVAFGVAVEVDIVPSGSLSTWTGLGAEGKVKRLLDLR